MDQSARFWDKIAQRYSKRPVADEAAYQRKLQVTQKYFRLDMEILEIGCGTGSTAIAHASVVKHIRAIDSSANMIEIAQAKARTADIRNVTFSRSSIDDYEAPDQSVDVVLALSVLHLLDDKDETIAKVHRMLKPGGIVVSSTACLGDTMKFLKFIAPIGKFLRLMPLISVFTLQELKDSFTTAGFVVEHEWQPGQGKAVFLVAKKPE